MTLRDEIEKQGDFLFRWRSYLPILMLPLFILGLRQSQGIERFLGGKAQLTWEVVCLLISLLGLFVRCLVAGYVPRGTSGRNTKGQLAEVLNTTGVYSIVRNPLYLGNFIIVLGVLLFTQAWWLVLIGTFGFLWYYERIIFCEEEFLRKKFGNTFVEWANKTPLCIPKFSNWQAPSLPFSYKTMLRREYSGFFGIVSAYFFLGILADLFSKGKVEIKLGWIIFYLVGLATYVTLRTLKKKTKLLDVQGR